MSYTQKSLLLCPRKGCEVLRRTCQNVCLCSSLSARVCQFSVFSFELLVRIICTFGTTCTNYFPFLTPRTDLSLKCARQYYQIVFFNFILFSLFFFFFFTRGTCSCTSCLATSSQTIASCILYTLHLYFELLGK